MSILLAFKVHLHSCLLLSDNAEHQVSWQSDAGRALGELPYRCIVCHFSYCQGEVWFLRGRQTTLLFISLFLDRKERIFYTSPLSPLQHPIVYVWKSHEQSKVITKITIYKKTRYLKCKSNKYKLLSIFKGKKKHRSLFLWIHYVLCSFDFPKCNVFSLPIRSCIGEETKK